MPESLSTDASVYTPVYRRQGVYRIILGEFRNAEAKGRDGKGCDGDGDCGGSGASVGRDYGTGASDTVLARDWLGN